MPGLCYKLLGVAYGSHSPQTLPIIRLNAVDLVYPDYRGLVGILALHFTLIYIFEANLEINTFLLTCAYT